MPHKRSKRSIREAETAKKGSNLAPSVKATNSMYDDTPKGASRIISGWKFQSKFRDAGRTNSEDTGEYSNKSSVNGVAKKGGESSKTKPNNNNIQTEKDKGKQKATPTPSTSTSNGKDKLPKIQSHESLGEYNRRIEDLLRSGVSKAIKDAASLKALEESNARKEKKERKKKMRLEKLVKDGKLPKEALDKFLVELKDKKRKRDEDSDEEEGEGDEEGGETKGASSKTKPIKEFQPLEQPRRLNDIVQAPPQLPHLRKSNTVKSTTGAKEAYSAIGKNSSRLPLNLGQKRILEEERERVVKLYRDIKAQKAEERMKGLESGGKKVKV